nr:PREDICTED: neprilysin-2-like [Bemisia tabaci]
MSEVTFMANQDFSHLNSSKGIAKSNNGLSFTVGAVVGLKGSNTNVYGQSNYNGYMMSKSERDEHSTSLIKLQNEDQMCIRENPLCNVPTEKAIPISISASGTGASCNNQKHMNHKQQRRKSSVTSSQQYVWLELDKTKKSLEKYFLVLSAVIIGTVLVLLAAVFFAQDTLSTSNQKFSSICLSSECVKTASHLISGMDRSVDPCSDFFQFACGTWNKRHVIPEDKSSISTFEVLADQLQVILKGVLEEPINNKDSSATIKAKTFYKSCMNVTQIRKIGNAPVKRLLESLGGWPVTTSEWTPPPFAVEYLFGRLKAEFNEGVLVEQWVGPDDKNSSMNILQLDQITFGLPSRDYFLKESSKAALTAYHRYMSEVAVLLGANVSTVSAELLEMLNFEINLANVSLAEVDRHDSSSQYTKLTVRELQQLVPQLNWLELLSTFLEASINENELVVSYSMPYFIEMGKLFKRTDRRVLHNYGLWRLISTVVVPHMVDEYQQIRTEYKRILLGILSERNRWSQCVEWTNKKLGLAVGALFIRENFNPEGKETAEEMIKTLREAFNELLAENHWMDDETRTVAKEKADNINERIAYPQILTQPEELNKEYQNLNVTEDNFLLNIFNVLRFDAHQNQQRLRRPVNKDKWTTEPAVVNAFYNPNTNNIVLPAGILQPMFYNQHSPKSLNYGGIGVVIGHEITHGFDDKGRQFDKDGNMQEWWNNATIRAFREQTQCIIDQYSRYKLDEVDLFLNGRMTQGENIADNGGLKQSFRAYRKWVKTHGEEKLLPGLNMTHDQLFFLNYAQIWCGTNRPEDALTKIRSSVHSPGRLRVLGPLSNSVDFARAYNCPPGSPMNPTSKCSVW